MAKSKLELEFEAELLQHAQLAARQFGAQTARFAERIRSRGGVDAVREYLHRHRPSDAFGTLADAGRLDLSMEARVIKGTFGMLFTDEEADACLALLLENGYFG